VTEESTFRFHVALEFREFDGKGNFVTCPKDKNVFKLRCNVEKRIVITVLQLSHARELKIERYNTSFRVTACMENLEKSLTAVSEMSGILLKVREVSGKNLVREK